MIPQAAPMLRVARYRSEIDAAISRVLGGSALILGPVVAQFEAAFAAYIGTNHAIGVNSGTDAIELGLRALGVGPGDEVITSALTAAGTAQAILHCGAMPRFVDVDPGTWIIDPGQTEAAIGPRTRAIVLVHLYGHPADARAFRQIADKHGVRLLEDCAQAHGAFASEGRIGTLGDASAFSFYPTKNLGALGDGGAVLTNDPAIAERVRALRSYGWDNPERISSFPGFNSRLDEMQASMLLAMLAHLDLGNQERRAGAALYRERFAQLPIGLPPDAPGAVFHQFAITHPGRDRLAQLLREDFSIMTAVHYTPPLHLQPAFHGNDIVSLPNTERLSSELLSLPIQPEIVGVHGQAVADAVVECLSNV